MLPYLIDITTESAIFDLNLNFDLHLFDLNLKFVIFNHW